MQARVSERQTAEQNGRTRLLKPSERIKGKFQNPVPTVLGTPSLIFKAMPLYIKNHEQRTPLVQPGPFRTDKEVYRIAPAGGLRVTWFGHSGMLVEMDGLRILIDPVWEERASPRQWFGPKRFFPPMVALEDLPELDAVLISHDHYDHMGEFTIRRLARLPCTARAQWVTALGVAPLLQTWGVTAERTVELDWTDTATVTSPDGPGLTITSVPARHFSGRSLFHRFETLWGAYVLKGSAHTVYFGADTGWWDGFTEIAEAFGPFDLTMLEIGAYNDLWKDIHLGPDNAARAFEAMGRKGLLMPIHWGLFDLALHGWKQPIERLLSIAEDSGLKLWSPEPGRPTDLVRNISLVDLWWQRNA